MRKLFVPSARSMLIWLLVFFPVGAALLALIVRDRKFDMYGNGRVMRRLGIICICVGVVLSAVGLSQALSSNSLSALIMMICYFLFDVVGGAALIWQGCIMMRRGARYQRYVSLLNSQNLRARKVPLSLLSAAYPASIDTVSHDLDDMLRRGYFSEAYVDAQQQLFVRPFPKHVDSDVGSVSQGMYLCSLCGSLNDAPKVGPIRCDCCGQEFNFVR